MKDSFQDHTDNLFRTILQFHKKEPGRLVWENIEKELDKDDEAALVKKRNAGFKKVSTMVLLIFILSSTLFYWQSHLAQPGRFMVFTDLKKPGSGTRILKPMKTFPIRLVSIESKTTVSPNSLYTNRIDVSDPDLSFPNIIYPVATFYPDFVQPITANQFFRPLKLSGNRLLSFQSFADQPGIKLRQSTFRGRFSITPYFSQEFAGYNFTDNDVTAPNGKEVEKAERNVFSASVGMYVNFKINKRWILQSGVSYSWSSSIMDSSQSYAEKNAAGDIMFKLNTASGFSFLHSPSFMVPMVGDSMATAKTRSELHYITVPLILSYRFAMRRFNLLAGAGVTFNILTHASLETDIYGTNYKQNESEIPLRGLKKINFGLLVKAEMQYRVNSKIAVSLIPSFKNTLGPINMSNSSLAAYPYNFGIGVGIVYLF